MSTPFRERNPVVIGAISMAVIAALMTLAFKAGDLPIIGGGDTYYAAFKEAGGLKANDEVRIAGVRVGKVRGIELAGDHVRVEFQVDEGAEFGPETGAADPGQDDPRRDVPRPRARGVGPDGGGRRDPGRADASRRTTWSQVFEGLAERSERIDTDQLAQSLDTMAALTKNTPEEFQAALQGRLRAVGQPRRARRGAQHPARQPREGVGGAR